MTEEIKEPMTQERLKKYVSLRVEVENQLERLARMRNNEKLSSVRMGDESKKTGTAHDRMEKAIIRRLEYEERALPQIEAAQAEMEAIEDAIDALENPLERDVLRCRYLDGYFHKHTPWRDVAMQVFGDDDDSRVRMAFRYHEDALKHIR